MSKRPDDSTDDIQRLAGIAYAQGVEWSPGELMSSAEFGTLMRTTDSKRGIKIADSDVKGSLRQGELMIFLGRVPWSANWVKVLTRVGIVAVHSPQCMPMRDGENDDSCDTVDS